MPYVLRTLHFPAFTCVLVTHVPLLSLALLATCTNLNFRDIRASCANFLFSSYFRGYFWKFTIGRRLHVDVMSDMICLNYFQKKYADTNLYSECFSTYLVLTETVASQ